MRRSSILISLAFGDTETRTLKIGRITLGTLNSCGHGQSITLTHPVPLMLSHTPVDLELVTQLSTRWQLTYWEPPLNYEYLSSGEATGQVLRTWHTLN